MGTERFKTRVDVAVKDYTNVVILATIVDCVATFRAIWTTNVSGHLYVSLCEYNSGWYFNYFIFIHYTKTNCLFQFYSIIIFIERKYKTQKWNIPYIYQSTVNNGIMISDNIYTCDIHNHLKDERMLSIQRGHVCKLCLKVRVDGYTNSNSISCSAGYCYKIPEICLECSLTHSVCMWCIVQKH